MIVLPNSQVPELFHTSAKDLFCYAGPPLTFPLLALPFLMRQKVQEAQEEVTEMERNVRVCGVGLTSREEARQRNAHERS